MHEIQTFNMNSPLFTIPCEYQNWKKPTKKLHCMYKQLIYKIHYKNTKESADSSAKQHAKNSNSSDQGRERNCNAGSTLLCHVNWGWRSNFIQTEEGRWCGCQHVLVWWRLRGKIIVNGVCDQYSLLVAELGIIPGIFRQQSDFQRSFVGPVEVNCASGEVMIQDHDVWGH